MMTLLEIFNLGKVISSNRLLFCRHQISDAKYVDISLEICRVVRQQRMARERHGTCFENSSAQRGQLMLTQWFATVGGRKGQQACKWSTVLAEPRSEIATSAVAISPTLGAARVKASSMVAPEASKSSKVVSVSHSPSS